MTSSMLCQSTTPSVSFQDVMDARECVIACLENARIVWGSQTCPPPLVLNGVVVAHCSQGQPVRLVHGLVEWFGWWLCSMRPICFRSGLCWVSHLICWWSCRWWRLCCICNVVVVSKSGCCCCRFSCCVTHCWNAFCTADRLLTHVLHAP